MQPRAEATDGPPAISTDAPTRLIISAFCRTELVQHRAAILVCIALGVVASALSLVPAVMLGRVVDRLTVVVAGGSWTGLLVPVSVLAGSGALAALAALAQTATAESVAEDVITDLRVHAYSLLLGAPFEYHVHNNRGALVSRLLGDVTMSRSLVTLPFVALVDAVVLAVVATIYVGSVSLVMTVVLVVLLGPCVALVGPLSRRMARLSKDGMLRNGAVADHIVNDLSPSSIESSRVWGLDEHRRRIFWQAASQYGSNLRKHILTSQFFGLAVGGYGHVLVGAVCFAGAVAVVNGQVSAGEVVALAFIAQRLLAPARTLAEIPIGLRASGEAYARVRQFESLAGPRAVARTGASDSSGGCTASSATAAAPLLEMIGVEYRYVQSDDSERTSAASSFAVEGLDLVLHRGETIALVGESGSGKTTVGRLATGLLYPTQGEVLIRGLSTRDFSPWQVPNLVGNVTQAPALGRGSIREVLTIGLDVPIGEVEEVCDAVGLYDTFAALPKAFDTPIGTDGYRLSGGERQRLAIARMLLRRPAIAILDEATSQLDRISEAKVFEALGRYLCQSAILMIAHRLATVEVEDEIIVMGGGGVVCRGSHDQLSCNVAYQALSIKGAESFQGTQVHGVRKPDE